MKEVPLAGKYSDQVVLVDDEDFELVSGLSWSYAGRGRTAYARHRFRVNGKERGVYMHVMLTGWPMADHVNGNGLDNQRSNLRPVSGLENNRNSRKPETYCGRQTSSRFKGVSLRRQSVLRPWRAFIKVNYRQLSLGCHVTEEAAARAYDRAALQYFGGYAQLNFPEEIK